MTGGLVLSLFLSLSHSNGCDIPGYTRVYDDLFMRAERMYWPPEQQSGGCKMKAQGIAESDLRIDAVSPVGAQCIMQIMPATQNDLETRFGVAGNIFSARHCIRLGAMYMASLFSYFSWDRTDECRYEVAVPAYNTGPGNIDRAQVEANGARCWPELAPVMHKVTGRHARETIGYADRIQSLRARMR